MSNVSFQISNTIKIPVGIFTVDEDTMLIVPKKTDPTETKRAGDLIAGDYFCTGRTQTFKIESVVE